MRAYRHDPTCLVSRAPWEGYATNSWWPCKISRLIFSSLRKEKCEGKLCKKNIYVSLLSCGLKVSLTRTEKMLAIGQEILKTDYMMKEN